MTTEIFKAYNPIVALIETSHGSPEDALVRAREVIVATPGLGDEEKVKLAEEFVEVHANAKIPHYLVLLAERRAKEAARQTGMQSQTETPLVTEPINTEPVKPPTRRRFLRLIHRRNHDRRPLRG